MYIKVQYFQARKNIVNFFFITWNNDEVNNKLCTYIIFVTGKLTTLVLRLHIINQMTIFILSCIVTNMSHILIWFYGFLSMCKKYLLFCYCRISSIEDARSVNWQMHLVSLNLKVEQKVRFALTMLNTGAKGRKRATMLLLNSGQLVHDCTYPTNAGLWKYFPPDVKVLMFDLVSSDNGKHGCIKISPSSKFIKHIACYWGYKSLTLLTRTFLCLFIWYLIAKNLIWIKMNFPEHKFVRLWFRSIING